MQDPVLLVSSGGMKQVSEVLFPEDPEVAEIIINAIFGDDLRDDILAIGHPFWWQEEEIIPRELERGVKLGHEPCLLWQPPMMGFAPATHYEREQTSLWVKGLKDSTAVARFLQMEEWSPNSDVDPVFRAFWTSAVAHLGWSGRSVPVRGLALLAGADIDRYMSKEPDDAHQSATRKASRQVVGSSAPKVKRSGRKHWCDRFMT